MSVANNNRARARRDAVIICPSSMSLKFLALIRFNSYQKTPPYLPEPTPDDE